MRTNIKINYLILETILRLTNTYKNVCDEYEFIEDILKEAKTGDIQSKFKSIKIGVKNKASDKNYSHYETISATESMDEALRIIEELTGVPKRYWSGQDRIKLGMRCTKDTLTPNPDMNIDIVNLDRDAGILYEEIRENPLSLDHGKYYLANARLKKDEIGEKALEDKEAEIVEMTSLTSLITILLINMDDAELVELVDKSRIYKSSKWKPYIKISDTPTAEGIIYKPAYIEIRGGHWVREIVRTLLSLRYDFTFKEIHRKNI